MVTTATTTPGSYVKFPFSIAALVLGGSSSKERYRDPPSSFRHQNRSETLTAKTWGGASLKSAWASGGWPAEILRRSRAPFEEFPPKSSGV